MRSPYRDAIAIAANKYELDPQLVEAVVLQESAGKADAFRQEPAFWSRYCARDPRFADEEPRRIASSYGLMQVMYTTALDHGYAGAPEGLFDIPTNLDIGCRILAKLKRRFTTPDLYLAAYNGGPGGVTLPQPQQYAATVLSRYQWLQAGTVRA
jgi:soluble lytic murein transglycosylase-like protein